MLWELVYISRAEIFDPEKQVSAILSSSRRRNQRSNITGLLVFDGSYFVQLLEGQKTLVERTLERIKKDNRHFDVHPLCSAKKESRDFPDWSMEFRHIYTKPRMVTQLTGVDGLQFGEPAIPSSTSTGVRMLRLVEEFEKEVMPPVKHDWKISTQSPAL